MDDHGTVRAVLGAMPAGWPDADKAGEEPFGLFLYSPEGEPRLVAMSHGKGAVIKSWSSGLSKRLELGSNDEQSGIRLYSPAGPLRLWMTEAGKAAGIGMTNEEGVRKIDFGIVDSANSYLAIADADSSSGVRIQADNNEARLDFFYPSGTNGVSLATDEAGGAGITFRDKDEEVGVSLNVDETEAFLSIITPVPESLPFFYAHVAPSIPPRLITGTPDELYFDYLFSGPIPQISHMDSNKEKTGSTRILTEESYSQAEEF